MKLSALNQKEELVFQKPGVHVYVAITATENIIVLIVLLEYTDLFQSEWKHGTNICQMFVSCCHSNQKDPYTLIEQSFRSGVK